MIENKFSNPFIEKKQKKSTDENKNTLKNSDKQATIGTDTSTQTP